MIERKETVTVSQELLDRLHDQIHKAGGDGVTMTDLVRSGVGIAPFRFASSKVRRAILNELVKDGLIKHELVPTKGRPADLYVSIKEPVIVTEAGIEIVRV